MGAWADAVAATYSHGTFRHGGLNQISLVGTKQEEVGGYYPDCIRIIEKSPFLKVYIYTCNCFNLVTLSTECSV